MERKADVLVVEVSTYIKIPDKKCLRITSHAFSKNISRVNRKKRKILSVETGTPDSKIASANYML